MNLFYSTKTSKEVRWSFVWICIWFVTWPLTPPPPNLPSPFFPPRSRSWPTASWRRGRGCSTRRWETRSPSRTSCSPPWAQPSRRTAQRRPSWTWSCSSGRWDGVHFLSLIERLYNFSITFLVLVALISMCYSFLHWSRHMHLIIKDNYYY